MRRVRASGRRVILMVMGTGSMRRAYTTCRFGQLHYVAAGAPSDKPTLVLLHQNPSSTLEYRHLIEAMAADRRVIAFDTPGYGMSDPPPAPESIAGYASAFADGIAALDLAGPLDLYGFHTGTFLAIELVLAARARVRRLALSGIPFRTPAERADRLAACRATKGPTDDGAEILERLGELWEFTVTQRTPGIPIDRAAEMFAERAKPLHRYWWAYDGVWSYEPEARLKLVAQPVLVAQPDEPIRRQSLDAARLFPHATVSLLTGLERDIFEPEAGLDQLVAALRAFLT